jgi:hypothetical protein
VLNRDRQELGAWNGPGSAARHFMPRCARDTPDQLTSTLSAWLCGILFFAKITPLADRACRSP